MQARWYVKVGRALGLVGTGLLLMATPVTPMPPCREGSSQEVTYSVSEECRAAGKVTFTSEPAACAVTVTGDDVGLPGAGTEGPSVDLRQGGWTLNGRVGSWEEGVVDTCGDAGTGRPCPEFHRACDATRVDDTHLSVRCRGFLVGSSTGGRPDGTPEDVDTCTVTLTEVGNP